MLALLLSSLGTVQPAALPPSSQAKPIVVIGRRIKDAEANLRKCIASNCPPDKEIDAHLALAETQIIAGDYKDARETLLRALSRNHDEARRYPIPVSDLYRAKGRVSAHLGYDKDYYRSTWGIYRTLKKGLPDDQTRQFQAKIEVAEMMGRTRGHTRARLYYDDISREALAAGRQDIAAIAELRSAMRHLPPSHGRPIIERIASDRDPKMRAPALEATLALARLAFEENDIAGAEAIQKRFAHFQIKRPILIYSPPYKLVEGALNNGNQFDSGQSWAIPVNGDGSGGGGPGGGLGGGGGIGSGGQLIPGGGSSPSSAGTLHFMTSQFSATKRLAPSFDDMWMDVAFEITPEGKVEKARVTRSSRGRDLWVKPVMNSLRDRRYTPTSRTANVRRLERYTYTAGYEGKTDTRQSGRSPAARIEYFDLSEEGATAS